MNIEIECPFDFGDKVYFIKKEWDRGEIECPFCHGNSTVDTGIISWQPKSGKRGLVSRLMAEYIEKPLILECKNCGGTGKIKFTHPPTVKKIYGVLKDINALHGGGWEYIEYIVIDNEENEHTVYGRDIRKVD